jgi:hypothetical protein
MGDSGDIFLLTGLVSILFQSKNRMPSGRWKTRRQKGGGRRKTKGAPKNIPPPTGNSQCHPRVQGGGAGAGCFPFEVLQKVAQKLGFPTSGGGEVEKGQVVQKIAQALGVDPVNQRSFLEKLPLAPEEKANLAKAYLRPAMPEGWKEDPDMWLDSNNIRDVMKQYEDANPKFKFLGPYPIDFAAPDPFEKDSKAKKEHCLIDEMCELNLDREELKGKEHIGIIYNLDPHDKDGSHWVANYIHLPSNSCYYFDSYGMKPPKQIYRFMQWLGIQEPNIKLGWNGRRFQKRNTECGMYCMYFLDRMLAGEPYLKFVRRAPPDRMMIDLRDWMFST